MSRSLLASSLALVGLGLLMASGGCANGGGVDGGSGGVGGQGASVTTGTKSGSTSSTTAQSTTGSSSTKSSTAAGMATNSSSSDTSTSSGSTTSTGTGGPMCTDPGPGEPNNTMAQAFNLGTIGDADGEGKSVSGMLDQTGSDVDWYTYHIDDNAFSVVDPTRQLFGPGIRICKYIACSSGNDPGVSCPGGTTADTQGGKHGCCWTGGQSVTVDFGCSALSGGGDDSLDVWVRIDHQGGAGCEAYKVDYHG